MSVFLKVVSGVIGDDDLPINPSVLIEKYLKKHAPEGAEINFKQAKQYMADQFDAAELDKRKAAARAKATAEHVPLNALERASAAYMAAVEARRQAAAAEDAAEATLEAVLREVEQGGPE